MIIIEHSTFDENSIATGLGLPEYSYWFVRKAFRRILEQFGSVVSVSEPQEDVDRIYTEQQALGIPSIFLSYSPPHQTLLNLRCPTIPVFAWEYDVIPTECWDGEARNDWRKVFASVPAAITHCRFVVDAVRKSCGANYPIWSVPAPVYRQYASRVDSARGWRDGVELELREGLAIDSSAIDLSIFHPNQRDYLGSYAVHALSERAHHVRASQRLSLSGVIYSAVFNPADGRKYWTGLIEGFVSAFRSEPEATLIIKTTHREFLLAVLPILRYLSRLGAFVCRVIIVHGYLAKGEYDQLLEATSYAVNSSMGEGQCLPLMEYMSAGRPAIAPRHTAMLDYISEDNAFVVSSGVRPAAWPHDPRKMIRCQLHDVSVVDLARCFRSSFIVARDHDDVYKRMSNAATTALREFCSDEVVVAQLEDLLSRVSSGSGPSATSSEVQNKVPEL